MLTTIHSFPLKVRKEKSTRGECEKNKHSWEQNRQHQTSSTQVLVICLGYRTYTVRNSFFTTEIGDFQCICSFGKIILR